MVPAPAGRRFQDVRVGGAEGLESHNDDVRPSGDEAHVQQEWEQQQQGGDLVADDGVGETSLERYGQDVVFLRIVHSKPFKAHLLQSPWTGDHMLVTIHNDVLRVQHPFVTHYVSAMPCSTGHEGIFTLETLQCSPDVIKQWSSVSATFYLQDSVPTEEHVAAITALVRAGGTLQELLIDPLPGLIGLQEAGHVRLVSEASMHRVWRLLSKGQVRMLHVLREPRDAFSVQSDSVVAMTMLELLRTLQSQDWGLAVQTVAAKRRRRRHAAGGAQEVASEAVADAADPAQLVPPPLCCETCAPKIVFLPSVGLPDREYLICLLSASVLHNNGVTHVPHGRARAEYVQLLQQAGVCDLAAPQTKAQREREAVELDNGGVGQANLRQARAVSSDELESLESLDPMEAAAKMLGGHRSVMGTHDGAGNQPVKAQGRSFLQKA